MPLVVERVNEVASRTKSSRAGIAAHNENASFEVHDVEQRTKGDEKLASLFVVEHLVLCI